MKLVHVELPYMQLRKFGYLSMTPRNFGSQVTIHPSAPQGNQCEISHFLASVGTGNLILHIPVVVNFLSQVIFLFLLYLAMLMYANEV